MSSYGLSQSLGAREKRGQVFGENGQVGVCVSAPGDPG